MELHDLLHFENIVIQMHNVPDADALASGFALYRYLVSRGKNPRLIYGGWEERMKPNLRLMVEKLSIPAEYVRELSEPELLVTVDCQPGQSNVQPFSAKTYAVIDHHEVLNRDQLPPLHEVMESYGSCATVLYEMLKREGFSAEEDIPLQTALYYGLFTDTSFFQELWHPADRDMWEELKPDGEVIDLLKNSNLTSEDLLEIGTSFSRHEIFPERRYGISQVHTADPNILGVVSDTFLEVESIDCCVVYTFLPRGAKLSVRSCTGSIRADELARYLTRGSGGGGIRKAGGFVARENLPAGEDWQARFSELLKERMECYFSETGLVYAGQPLDMEGFALYRKLPIQVGVVDLVSLVGSGSRVKIRTLEGDIDLTVNEDQLLMIGVNEEIYPIRRAAFEKNYRLTGNTYAFQSEYAPKIRSYETGGKISLEGKARECLALGTSLVYAKRLQNRVHVFTIWDPQKYITGEAGDWIAVSKENPNDVYIIASGVFAATYEKA